ncbi:bacterio-opsin activator domain-containing protein [Natronobiforma cellulositropha]|uniref:bacterio-opsin activator domain-containing protein n=1 Tax=Natronobiforma cellulositropha TaxID=1679076 RepID=UPI0021D5F272|nr:bacterio-opsin activator domain-containing protein [Natronobiforma cellulositropha]
MSDGSALATDTRTRVLVVGDSARLAETTSAITSAVVTPGAVAAVLATDALESLRHSSADCIVCDVRPQTGPIRVLDAIREVDGHVPIVALVDRADVETALSSGASDVFFADDPPALACARVANALERAHSRHTPAEPFYRTVLEHAGSLVFVFDADGGFRYVSPAIESITGHTPDEVERVGPSRLVHPADTAALFETIGDLRDASLGETRWVTCRIARTDGTWQTAVIRMANRLTDPAVTGIVATVFGLSPRDSAGGGRSLERTVYPFSPSESAGLASTLRSRDRTLSQVQSALDARSNLSAIAQRVVCEALEADTRSALEQRVCAALLDLEWVDFVWIGREYERRIVPHACAPEEKTNNNHSTNHHHSGPTHADSIGRSIDSNGSPHDSGPRSYLDRVDLTVGDGGVPPDTDDRSAPPDTDDHSAPPDTDDRGELASHDDRGEPACRAVATDEVTVVDRIALETGQPWATSALDAGFHSALSVPLSNRTSRHGVLSVYATQPAAFDTFARSTFSHVGTVLAFAIDALETKRALLTTDVVNLEFELRGGEDLLSRLARGLDCRVSLESYVPRTDGYLALFVRTSNGSEETVLEYARRLDGVSSVRPVAERDDGSLFELVATSSLVSLLADAQAVLRSATADGSRTRVLVDLPQGSDVRLLVDTLEASFDEVSLLARREGDRTRVSHRDFRSALAERLTEKQRLVLETAYVNGYFEWPRERTGEEIADSLGIAQPTFNRHFRTAERKLFTLLFEE